MRDTELGIDRTVATPWIADDPTDVAIDEESADAFHGLSEDPLLGDAADRGPVASPAGSVRASPFAAAEVHPPAGDREPVPAVAAIDGHPLHPMIVPLPIGSFVGAFVSDLAYLRTGDPFWARSARYLTGAGIVTGLLAGSLGAMDFTGRRRVRSHAGAWVHAGGNLAVLGLAVVSESMRSRDERGAAANGALAISALSAAILGVTGWLGGELSYRARIGVTPA
ncbi:MAG TPA: DUF2231 domain-containing protein [Candidatus Limnocylindrales bacterium]|nr:DUF2231 domain-containing protein [Candidatus Limnocylindrales bacterium]